MHHRHGEYHASVGRRHCRLNNNLSFYDYYNSTHSCINVEPPLIDNSPNKSYNIAIRRPS